MSTKWREVRVFISSTFRDMHAERDHLIKVVFPKLREKLEKYKVYLIDIDLRWGITREQADNDQVLELCLEQIDKSRPFFIGILGGRYGHVPQRIPNDVLNNYCWLHSHSGKSITELEMLHGILNNPRMHGQAFFFFRSPDSLSQVPDVIKKEVFIDVDPILIKKLSKLKKRIKGSGFPFETYSARWNKNTFDRPTKRYGRLMDLDNLGVKLEHQLWEGIKNELKLPKEPSIDVEADPNTIERDYHESFVDSRLRFYVSRIKIQEELIDKISNSIKPIVITGAAGSGKSTLMSWLYQKYKFIDPSALIIPNFVGASAQSTNLQSVLQSFCSVLKSKYKFDLELPEDTLELIATFRSFLFNIPKDQKIIFLIDGVDQFDGLDQPEELAWLPRKISKNVRIILSCIDILGEHCRILERAREKEFEEQGIGSLKLEEQKEIIRKIPSVSAKTLDVTQADLLLSNPATTNPLFLSVALEELKGFGSFYELNERISRFPKPNDPPIKNIDIIGAIFHQVIHRLGDDFGSDLVRLALSLLACSRRGLSERELKELVCSKPEMNDIFPVLRQLRPYLMKRGELLDFFHRGLEKAIRIMFLRDAGWLIECHERLADHFQKYELGQRKIDELPWQLTKSHSWHKLYDLLSDLTFLKAALAVDKFNVRAYWALIEHNSQYQITMAYQQTLNFPAEDVESTWDIAKLLKDTGHNKEALPLWGQLVKHYQTTENFLNLQGAIGNTANILLNYGDLDRAWWLLKQQEEICRSIGNAKGLAISLGNQAIILRTKGNIHEAFELLSQQERISRSLSNNSGLQVALGNQAEILIELRKLDKAMNLLKLQEQICREIGDFNGLPLCIGNQAVINMHHCKYEKSMELFKEQERICHHIGNKSGLSTSFINQGILLDVQGKFDEALEFFRQAEQNSREWNDTSKLALALANQAFLLAHKLNKSQDALPLINEAYELTTVHGLSLLADKLQPTYDLVQWLCSPSDQTIKRIK